MLIMHSVLSGAIKEFSRNQKYKYWLAYMTSDFCVKTSTGTHRNLLLLNSQKLD